jgi:hypothetical protein
MITREKSQVLGKSGCYPRRSCPELSSILYDFGCYGVRLYP